MYNIKLQTADGRTQVIADGDQSPRDLFEEHDISLDGATVSLNGVPLRFADLEEEFEVLLEDQESAILSVVVKLENAGV